MSNEQKIAEILCTHCASGSLCDQKYCDKAEEMIKAVQSLIASEQAPLLALLKEAKCPNCDGSGAIPHQISDRQVVTHDMASDAGNAELEGSLYSQERFELEQCQWCDERKRLLEVSNGQS